jgi:imidazolonepropionase-like amidohydrolase
MVDVELNKPEAAAPLVRALKSQGVDALKVYFMLDPPVLAAVVKEAHSQGLPVTGHIGVHTGWREAMSYGIDGLNHIRVWKDFLPRDQQPQGDHESLDASRNMVARMQADWTGIDPTGAKAEALIKTMAEKHVGFDPTLSIQRISPQYRSRLGLEEFEKAQDSYKRMGQFVVSSVTAGVMLLAGTDDGSLFDELEAYADAGIPNKIILQAATANGARWLRKDAQFGTIEAGKLADIVLVDGDPLKDIKDLRKIWMVIKDGRIVLRK